MNASCDFPQAQLKMQLLMFCSLKQVESLNMLAINQICNEGLSNFEYNCKGPFVVLTESKVKKEGISEWQRKVQTIWEVVWGEEETLPNFLFVSQRERFNRRTCSDGLWDFRGRWELASKAFSTGGIERGNEAALGHRRRSGEHPARAVDRCQVPRQLCVGRGNHGGSWWLGKVRGWREEDLRFPI